jgi:lipid-A-disaccharide synthase
MNEAPLFYIIAGEPSGDLLGGGLMAALRRRAGDDIRFAGIGGPAMIAEGLRPLFPMQELSVMGLAEIAPKIPRLLRRIGETAADVRSRTPAALITIDAPDFSFRVARRVHGAGFPCIHYVAPTVWAWRPGRAAKIARFLDHLLALLPFEPPWFEREGLHCSFVGHPAISADAKPGDGPGFRTRHGLDPARTVVLMLPGSRAGEVSRLLPPFIAALQKLRQGRSEPRIVAPVPAHLAPMVRDGLRGSGLDWQVLEGDVEKRDAFAAADVALSKSGTVILELALAGVPTVLAYRINPMTHEIAHRMITARYAGLPNLILDRPLMPELLQHACTPDRLCVELARLLDDPAARLAQIDGVAEVRRRLTPPGGDPSATAAEIVLGLALARGAGPQRSSIAT